MWGDEGGVVTLLCCCCCYDDDDDDDDEGEDEEEGEEGGGGWRWQILKVKIFWSERGGRVLLVSRVVGPLPNGLNGL